MEREAHASVWSRRGVQRQVAVRHHHELEASERIHRALSQCANSVVVSRRNCRGLQKLTHGGCTNNVDAAIFWSCSVVEHLLDFHHLGDGQRATSGRSVRASDGSSDDQVVDLASDGLRNCLDVLALDVDVRLEQIEVIGENSRVVVSQRAGDLSVCWFEHSEVSIARLRVGGNGTKSLELAGRTNNASALTHDVPKAGFELVRVLDVVAELGNEAVVDCDSHDLGPLFKC